MGIVPPEMETAVRIFTNPKAPHILLMRRAALAMRGEIDTDLPITIVCGKKEVAIQQGGRTMLFETSQWKRVHQQKLVWCHHCNEATIMGEFGRELDSTECCNSI
jgi:hypothetical protein